MGVACPVRVLCVSRLCGLCELYGLCVCGGGGVTWVTCVWGTLGLVRHRRLVRVLLFLITAAVLVSGCGEPTGEGAEAYVMEAFNNPRYVNEWWYDHFQTSDGTPPEVIDDAFGQVKLKGDCASLRIRTPDTPETIGIVFLHWDGEEWYPTDYATSSSNFDMSARLGYYRSDIDSCFSPLTFGYP